MHLLLAREAEPYPAQTLNRPPSAKLGCLGRKADIVEGYVGVQSRLDMLYQISIVCKREPYIA